MSQVGGPGYGYFKRGSAIDLANTDAIIEGYGNKSNFCNLELEEGWRQ